MKELGVGLISIRRPKWKEVLVIRRKGNDSILGEFEHMEIKSNMVVVMALNLIHSSNYSLSPFTIAKTDNPTSCIFKIREKPHAGMYLKRRKIEPSIYYRMLKF